MELINALLGLFLALLGFGLQDITVYMEYTYMVYLAYGPKSLSPVASFLWSALDKIGYAEELAATICLYNPKACAVVSLRQFHPPHGWFAKLCVLVADTARSALNITANADTLEAIDRGQAMCTLLNYLLGLLVLVVSVKFIYATKGALFKPTAASSKPLKATAAGGALFHPSQLDTADLLAHINARFDYVESQLVSTRGFIDGNFRRVISLLHVALSSIRSVSSGIEVLASQETSTKAAVLRVQASVKRILSAATDHAAAVVSIGTSVSSILSGIEAIQSEMVQLDDIFRSVSDALDAAEDRLAQRIEDFIDRALAPAFDKLAALELRREKQPEQPAQEQLKLCREKQQEEQQQQQPPPPPPPQRQQPPPQQQHEQLFCGNCRRYGHTADTCVRCGFCKKFLSNGHSRSCWRGQQEAAAQQN